MGRRLLQKRIKPGHKRTINKQIGGPGGGEVARDPHKYYDYPDNSTGRGIARGASQLAAPRMFNMRNKLRVGRLRSKIGKASKH